MAAFSELRTGHHEPRLVDLRQVYSDELDALLEEETESWKQRLSWDFRPSADLVRRFVRMQALSGFGLVAGGQLIGYSYYVVEERKGLIGDLYVRRELASAETENVLLSGVLKALMETPYLRRIESQLMMLRSHLDRPVPYALYLQSYERNFMVARLDEVDRLPLRVQTGCEYETWVDRRKDEVAHLIAQAYRGHVDSNINDQYRSTSGARRFLTNIVEYPGCGTFHQPSSYVAVEAASGRVSGVCLTSLVSGTVGHVTQICVSPGVKGRGVGYELLRHSLRALAAQGCRTSSLTVTAANRDAIRLYERIGFGTHRQFAAYVWDGF